MVVNLRNILKMFLFFFTLTVIIWSLYSLKILEQNANSALYHQMLTKHLNHTPQDHTHARLLFDYL